MSSPSHTPTPAEIAEVCERIRAGWDPVERLKRLRPDWRPIAWALAELESDAEPGGEEGGD